ncbi:dTMP kinase [Oscillospiraceae bacterium LTW-04]|nr:thymidylate kinase [Oscillospiraceae bacterium MB24-C1]
MNGRLIVFEGLDGSGKATQAAKAVQRLEENGQAVRAISFPDYNSESSALVKMYLRGEVGALDDVNVYAASGFYSLDRYISYQREWKNDYQAGKTVIADRYTTSNLCHQMAKLPRDEWVAYISWLEYYEYVQLALPKPDLVLYLDMHPAASQRLMAQRYNGDEAKKDLHERNRAYLESCREAALFAADTLGWVILPCSDAAHNPYPVDVIADAAFAEISRLSAVAKQ